jgi:hypothetical protein
MARLTAGAWLQASADPGEAPCAGLILARRLDDAGRRRGHRRISPRADRQGEQADIDRAGQGAGRR